MRVRFSPEARAELKEIGRYIRDQGAPKAAAALVTRVTRAADGLGYMPERYQEDPAYGRGLRRVVVGNYLLLYRVGNAVVDVVSVRDGRREPNEIGR